MPICCFWLEETDLVDLYVGRYTREEASLSPCTREGGHRVRTLLGRYEEGSVPSLENTDPRWPTHCECGFEFRASDPRYQITSHLYRRENGDLMVPSDAPPGAMWDQSCFPWKGPDGRSIVVKLPNGNFWHIDSRASNCTLLNDDEHRCWVRHGEPPKITVDKNGLTCQAGAGSIQSGDYHGFLRDGCFT